MGAFLSDQNNSSPGIGVGYSNLGPGQSWVIETSTAGQLNLENPIGTAGDWENLNTFVNGNHIIEAMYTPVPEPSSAALLLSSAVSYLALVVLRRTQPCMKAEG